MATAWFENGLVLLPRDAAPSKPSNRLNWYEATYEQ
jgi:hypothetical protein